MNKLISPGAKSRNPDQMSTKFLKIIYAGNIVVAGTVGALSLFAPAFASERIFHQAAGCITSTQTTGALWLGIAFLSVCGLKNPLQFSPTLLLQVFYKSAFLVFSAIPAWRAGKDVPSEMAAFFVVWITALPFAIPWRYLFSGVKPKTD